MAFSISTFHRHSWFLRRINSNKIFILYVNNSFCRTRGERCNLEGLLIRKVFDLSPLMKSIRPNCLSIYIYTNFLTFYSNKYTDRQTVRKADGWKKERKKERRKEKKKEIKTETMKDGKKVSYIEKLVFEVCLCIL